MPDLDLSQPIRRPSDQGRLIEGIITGTLGVDETTWVEWKSQVDWSSAEDVAAKVARHVIGFANRDPIEAQAFVGGEAYLVLLYDPAQPSMTQIDPADIENKVSTYLGTDGPQWSPSYADFNGNRSLVLTVAPPRAGDHIHTLRKQAGKHPNGAVFVRRPGKTAQADSLDMRRLELRAQAATTQIAIEIGARPNTLQRLDLVKDVAAYIESERNRLLAPLAAEERRVGGGQQAVLEAFIGQGILYKDRRKPSEFRAQCEEYLRDLVALYTVSGHHMAALKGLGTVELRATNPSARNLLGVEVELLLPPDVVASRGRSDEPERIPHTPLAWGSDTALSSMVSSSWLGPDLVPRAGFFGPGVWHLASIQGLVFEAFDLRPYKHRTLLAVHLFYTGSSVDATVELRWRATAQNTDSRAEGTLSFEMVSAPLTLKDLLGAAREP